MCIKYWQGQQDYPVVDGGIGIEVIVRNPLPEKHLKFQAAEMQMEAQH